MSETEIVDLEQEVGPQERKRRERPSGKFPEEQRKRSRRNPVTCTLNKGEFLGPLKGCEEDCPVFQECLEWAKEGYPGALLYSSAYRPIEGESSLDCPYCEKPIARASTNKGSYLGMLTMHVRAAHRERYPDEYEEWKENFLSEEVKA